MENASKALLMAGEVLIGLIVIGLMVAAVSTFGGFSADMNDKLSEKTVVTFNQHYWEYQGRIDISAEEIASIINFSKQSNDDHELNFSENAKKTDPESVYWVDVYIEDDTSIEKAVFGDIIGETEYNNLSRFRAKVREFIESNNTQYYYCSINKAELKIKNTVDTDNTDKDKKIIVQMEDNNDIDTSDVTKMITEIHFHRLNKVAGFENFNLKGTTLDEYYIATD